MWRPDRRILVSVADTDALAQFLRARRELVHPADVGLPEDGRRRVVGLRREEVAMLAGISAEYYLRLEQGRDRHPSEQVLDGIARALQLEDDAASYMHNLARYSRPKPRRRTRRARRVDPALQDLIDSWPLTAAHIQDHTLTVIAANRLACALTPYWAPGVNSLRAAFLEPEMRDFYENWDELAALTGSGRSTPARSQCACD